MEGPTPVSALLHAATMVTAGVYLVARFSPLFASAGAALHAVAWVGGITALFAALMAATEYDIKRVLAYSTISQIGYMFVGNGVEASAAAIFHFVTHAFFKALLFLGAGAIMHALAGEIDMRKMGGLRKAMPVVAWTFGIGALAISGIFPFAGFWSKDAILASAWAHGQYALWAIGIATAFLTAFYMFRLYFRVFEGDLVVPEGAHPHDAPLLMKAALIPLAIGSVFVGAVNLPHFLTLEHFLGPVLGTSAVPAGLAPWFLTAAALAIAVAGIALAYALYMAPEGTQRRARLGAALPWLVESARNKFYVDEAYGALIVLPGKRVATFFASVVDARVIDGAVNGIAGLFGGLADGVRRIQTGYVRNYAVTFFFGAVVIFSIVVLTVVRT
jgi:NADH-quinone oxidoreductase subunit L